MATLPDGDEVQTTSEDTIAGNSARRFAISDGVGLVNRTERLICESGAARSAGVAAGMALAGLRAARFLELNEPGPGLPDSCEISIGPCVYHSLTDCPPPPSARMPTVLVAGSYQEAVDHCLVAHLLTDQLGISVVSLVDRALAESFGVAQMLDTTLVSQILPRLDGGAASFPERELPVRSACLSAAVACFAKVNESLLRNSGPILHSRLDKARNVVIAAGALARESQAALQLLEETDSQLGLVTVTLLRPFPHELLRELIPPGARLLVPLRDSCEVSSELCSHLESALEDDQIEGSELVPVVVEDPSLSSKEFLQRITQTLPAKTVFSIAEQTSPEAPVPDIRLGVTPGGGWAEETLLEAAKLLALSLGLEDCEVSRRSSGLFFSVTVSRAGARSGRSDVLVIVGNPFVDPTSAVRQVQDKSMVILFSPAVDSVSAWHLLPEIVREETKARHLELWWLNLPEQTLDAGECGLRSLLLGAVLGLVASKAKGRNKKGLLSQLEDLLARDGASSKEIALFQSGVKQMERLNPSELEAAVSPGSLSVAAGEGLPFLREVPSEAEADTNWETEIRDFHLTGSTTRPCLASVPDLPLVPALLSQLGDDNRMERRFPFYLPDREEKDSTAQPVLALFREAIEECEKEGRDFRILKDHLDFVTSSLAEEEGASFEAVLQQSLDKLPERFDLSDQGKAELREELEVLQLNVAKTGKLLNFDKAALIGFVTWAFAMERLSYRLEFVEKVKQLVVGLENLLLVDRQSSPEGRSAEAFSAVMGKEAAEYLDSSALSEKIPPPKGPLGLTPDRRARIEAARMELVKFLSENDRTPLYYLVHPKGVPANLESAPFTGIEHDDCVSTALGFFDGLMAGMLSVFKAVRIAHLEIEGDYNPQIHDPLLTRFSWQACDFDELQVLTPVVVMESADHFCRRSLGPFNRLVRTGRPISVVIWTSESSLQDDELSGHFPDLGYLGIAHREAFVLQSSLTQPAHLTAGLRRLAAAVRPAVAVVTVPEEEAGSTWAWARLLLAQFSRSLPAFCYDPDLGTSWAERFTLESNPAPEETWLQVRIPYQMSDGSPGELQEALTFAHAAALNPAYRRHFHVIPRVAWTEEQLELAQYLDLYRDSPPEAYPFIWVVGWDRELQRAIVTRELIQLCRDRQRAWGILQELAGINNEHVRRAVDSTRHEVETAARENLDTLIASARQEGAAQAIDRLVTVFTHPDAFREVPPPATVSPETDTVSPVESEPSGQPAAGESVQPTAAVEEEEDFSAEPYIDTFLCTSCNDCINLNPLMFQYNGDKQAFVADPSAGTYLQLVKAAEACPAKCIHPGAPQPGDETATEEVKERAKIFQ